MGIHINLAVLMRDWVNRHQLAGPVVTLGVQRVTFYHEEFAAVFGKEVARAGAMRPMTSGELFRALGLGDAIALDINDREGADLLFDLNREELPTDLRGRFKVVFNGGTLEHIFHVPNALANIAALLQPGGVVIHVLPMNNWVDHGFYQFSPTLMFDYYAAARFDLLESLVVAFNPRRAGGASWEVSAAPRGMFGGGSPGALDDRAHLHLFLARRTDLSIERPIPVQAVYSAASPAEPCTRWFSPFDLHYGTRQERPNLKVVPIKRFERERGFAWSARVPELAPWGDSNEHPATSRVIVLEDSLPLGPAHAAHEDIRNTGGGAFSHWGDTILLSTSDNSDPRTNGRSYTAVLPAPVR